MRNPSLVTSLLVALLALTQCQQATPSGQDETARAAERARQMEAQLKSPRPIEAMDSVWIEELTWMEVRDALAAGKTTAIISTGGIEQNGPYVATGKHNYIMAVSCDAIARSLGNALCAPVIKLVPEGNIDPPSGHMRFPGTISLRQETYRQVLDDVASSLAAHGFRNIVFIGDSGGNLEGMKSVSDALNQRWTAARAHYIPEFYDCYEELFQVMEREFGITETANDGLHDDAVMTTMMMVHDPNTVRHAQRVAAGKATINGVSIADKERAVEIGERLLAARVKLTVEAIRKSIDGS